MSAVLTPPRPAPTGGPRLFRWSLSAFHHLGDMGYFEGRRAKLIDGQLIEEGPMDPPHAISLEKSDAVLRDVFGRGWRYRIQTPLVLGQATDPMPDIAVIRGAPGALVHPNAADLVVEVADSSLNFDLTTKAELYATAGIADYWVLDVDGRTLHVLRDPVPLPMGGLGATAYRTHLTLTDADSVTPLAAPGATVRVAELLP